MDNQTDSEERSRERRRQLIEEAKYRKKRQMMIRGLIKKLALPVAGAAFLGLLLTAGIRMMAGASGDGKEKAGSGGSLKTQEAAREDGEPADAGTAEMSREEDNTMAGGTKAAGSGEKNTGEADAGEGIAVSAVTEENGTGARLPAGGGERSVPSAASTAETVQLGGEIVSSHAILIDMDSDSILAQKAAMDRINPASMTKILTVLVAAEHVENLDDRFTITREITDYSYVNDCSSAGFAVNETVSVRDLFYGTILPSGADAAAGLAFYVAGSQEAFVEMMNEKLQELGLSETAHFTNCVGIYDSNHYCTAYDMAVILRAALQNDLCREVLSAHTYITSATEQHPEGITISNWFLRRIEDKDTGGEVVCGKTGYVVQSGSCAASYGVDAGGKEYICVTAGANSSWRCIYDHVALYKQFAEEA